MSCTFRQVDFYNGDGSNTWECSNCKEVFYFDEEACLFGKKEEAQA